MGRHVIKVKALEVAWHSGMPKAEYYELARRLEFGIKPAEVRNFVSCPQAVFDAIVEQFGETDNEELDQ